MNSDKINSKEVSAEIRNKLQAGKSALEALRDGKKVSSKLIEIAIRDIEKIQKLLAKDI